MMTKRIGILMCLLLVGQLVCQMANAQHHPTHHKYTVEGVVLSSEDNSVVDFATVYFKDTNIGVATDDKGRFKLHAHPGTYTLVVSAVGYTTYEKKITLGKGSPDKMRIVLQSSITQLDEVVVVSSGVSRIKKTAYNALAVDTKELQNTTKTLSDALAVLPGMKLRESGGVGSDMQLMLDGFSGKHVKVFIDGIPQEGAGSAFSLNNIPVSMAERIEVYKGVVPVGFGADALGGIINIVTKQNQAKWHLDASYSFGSFNTHRSTLNAGQSFANGLFYELNAFQNYSDNSYYIDTYVQEFNPDGSIAPLDKNKIWRVKRFNDTFHNEALVAKVGVKDKPWADQLSFGVTYSQFYKEIQTGVYQHLVFGEKFRNGFSVVPAIEYRKRNLFTRGLDLTLSANYNLNITNNVDTASYQYNWFGHKRKMATLGEQSYQNSRSRNAVWNGTLTSNYRIGEYQTLTLNHVASAFARHSQSFVGATNKLTSFDMPKTTIKHITGLSYRLMPSDKWNVSVFGKHYYQFNEGPVSTSADGVGNYELRNRTVSSLGYGLAGTYFIIPNLQAKLSYEHAYRLPNTEELFGDDDMESGKTNLRPEKSDNVNINLSYNIPVGKHALYVEGGYIYRDTKDYIRRALSRFGGTQFASYENHGRVVTSGYNLSMRYSYSNWFNMGGTFNQMDAIDHEPFRAGGTTQTNLNYMFRIPNQPYQFANADASVVWHNLFAKGNTLTLEYSLFYQKKFPLYAEGLGDPSTKNYVPDQLSHNVTLNYMLRRGKYNISLECRNLSDSQLFDNFSLQKAGRAFYAKFRVSLGNHKHIR